MPSHEELQSWMLDVARADDAQAFARLFQHFAPRIKGFLVRAGCAPGLAEELSQETMIKVWRKAGLFDPLRANVSTWVYTLARNTRIDHYRRESEALPADEPDDELAAHDPPDPAAGPDDRAGFTQRAERVRQALADLPPQQALVIRMSFFEQHPQSEIARSLSVPLGTVKSRIRLAVAQLRRLLDELQP